MVVLHVAGSKPKALLTAPAQKAMAVRAGLYRDYLNRLVVRPRSWLARLLAR